LGSAFQAMGEIQLRDCMTPETKQLRPAQKKAPNPYKEFQPEGEDLLGNLHNIKEAIGSIWIPNVHVINDFTDHGKQHSERVLNWASYLLPILKENTGRDLSDVERYLLLASGFLHDIGMQCDIIKFPHIKKEAEELGADFSGVVFDAKSSSNYSSTAQGKIRDNHHYLAAAWIQCAYTNRGANPVSGLDDAAKLIKPLLVQDLKDICLYHSKSPIDTNFGTSKYDKNIRLQLIAVLLRFADELDIDLFRVPTGIHKNFRLSPENIRYWWFHERTHIYLDYECEKGKIVGGVITLEVCLHPDDIDKYGSLVQEKVIGAFNKKCEDLLKILASYRIPLSIKDLLSPDTNLERMPGEISEEITRE
jgi:hypothetical protein